MRRSSWTRVSNRFQQTEGYEGHNRGTGGETKEVSMDASGLPPGPAGVPSTPAGDLGQFTGTGRATVTVATYADYASARRAVDYLTDNGFPVERTAIIGTGLRLVERVLGRLTTGRAALAGAASGAWFGLFIGLLLGLFSRSAWWAVILFSVLIGTAWGAAFGAVAHAMTGGPRDFTSRS